MIVSSVLCQGDGCVNPHFQDNFVCLVVSSSKKKEKKIGVGGGVGGVVVLLCVTLNSVLYQCHGCLSPDLQCKCVWLNLDCCQETQLCCCSSPVWDLEFSSLSGRWVDESGFCNVSVCAFGLLPKNVLVLCFCVSLQFCGWAIGVSA